MRQLQLRSRLCALTPSDGADLAQRVHEAVEAGVGLVRYDAAKRSTRQMVDEASDLVRMARRVGIPLLVSGRVDVALAVTADGVHLTGEDLPVAVARRILGPGAILGVTVWSVADAREAQREGASYLAVDEAALVAEVRQVSTLPLSLDVSAWDETGTAGDLCAITLGPDLPPKTLRHLIQRYAPRNA